MWLGDAMVFMIPIVSVIVFFAFLSVIGWAVERRKERESYYRFEFRKRMVESGKLDADGVSSLMALEQGVASTLRRQASLIAGLVLLGSGVGMLLGLRWIDEGVWMTGYIPLSIGAGLLLYAFAFAPAERDDTAQVREALLRRLSGEIKAGD